MDSAGLCPRCLLAMNLRTRTLLTNPGAAAETAAPSPEEMGGRFPQFEFLECLGRGGMGVVYKARQKALDRLVAIKILAGEWQQEPGFAERFAREARLLARLTHPAIVTVHDFGEVDGLYYLVMEYVDGVNLRDLLHDGRLEPQQALAIVAPVCEALQYAHAHGIVHRDIKPENLLLDREGRVKIGDFGIATLAGDAPEASGTPAYMAPEQAARSRTADHRVDLYALGVVLYEMLTGERPGRELAGPSLRVQMDVRIDEIVLRALARQPEMRFQSAGEMGTMVKTAGAAPVESAAATGNVVARRPRKLVGSRMAVMGLAGSTLGVLALCSFFGADLNRQAQAPVVNPAPGAVPGAAAADVAPALAQAPVADVAPVPVPGAAPAALPTSPLAGKLQHIVLPLIDFEDTSLEEAVDFIRLRVKEGDGDETDPAKKGFNLLIQLPAGFAGKPGESAFPRIKELRLRNVPVGEALRYLCDATGTRYRLDESAVVLLPAAQSDASPEKPATELSPSAARNAAKLSAIRIPVIEFEDTSLEEAIDFMRLRMKELDTVETGPSKKGLNFVVQAPAMAPAAAAGESAYPHIRELRLRNIPADELLRYIGDATGTRCRIDDCAVVILPAGRADAPREKPVVDASPDAARIAAKLSAIRLPMLNFQDTSVEEAVDFLRGRAKELDNAEPDPTRKGVNFVIRRPAASASSPGLRVKALSLRDVPVGEALRYVCEATGLRYHVDGYAVTLEPSDAAVKKSQ
jgi:predicted Ser/Thr protein kinase